MFVRSLINASLLPLPTNSTKSESSLAVGARRMRTMARRRATWWTSVSRRRWCRRCGQPSSGRYAPPQMTVTMAAQSQRRPRRRRGLLRRREERLWRRRARRAGQAAPLRGRRAFAPFQRCCCCSKPSLAHAVRLTFCRCDASRAGGGARAARAAAKTATTSRSSAGLATRGRCCGCRCPPQVRPSLTSLICSEAPPMSSSSDAVARLCVPFGMPMLRCCRACDTGAGRELFCSGP